MKNKDLRNLKLGIMGVGMVGGALKRYFENKAINSFLYDKGKNLGSVEEVNQAEVIFICVPTPFDKEKGFDLSFIEQACRDISGEKIIVIKSTVLPGTTEKLQQKYSQHKFLFNPEFLTEFTADQDIRYPDRQIIGYTKQSYNIARDILKILSSAPFEKIMPATEAEMVKLFSNTWFSTKVIFANQIYDLCQKLGIDYEKVKEAAKADKMIGKTHLEIFHKGYRGYSGKCLSKDIKALIQFANEQGIDLKLHKIVEQINNGLMRKQGIDDPEKFSKRN